jgi:regulatory protein
VAQKSSKAVYTYEQALEALQHYCAYQDRCHQEARQKLKDLGFRGEEAESIIVDLIGEKFLDEERFARTYARGKFRMKRWGRYRIKRELKQRDISDYCIRKAMEEIEESAYLETLEAELLRRDRQEKKAKHPYLRRRKLANYAVSRGFEAPLVWETINRLGL